MVMHRCIPAGRMPSFAPPILNTLKPGCTLSKEISTSIPALHASNSITSNFLLEDSKITHTNAPDISFPMLSAKLMSYMNKLRTPSPSPDGKFTPLLSRTCLEMALCSVTGSVHLMTVTSSEVLPLPSRSPDTFDPDPV